jgi:hypothetical protein
MPDNKILEAYRSELIGRRFVYTSKYGGETLGVIKNIECRNINTYDKETCAIIADYLRKKREDGIKMPLIDGFKIADKVYPGPKEISDAKASSRYRGIKTEYSMVSENGVTYGMNEIFIIDNNEK